MKNKKRGFLRLIILIVIALFIMKYFNITISSAYNWISAWFIAFFSEVLK